jgi:hypothetical protein
VDAVAIGLRLVRLVAVAPVDLSVGEHLLQRTRRFADHVRLPRLERVLVLRHAVEAVEEPEHEVKRLIDALALLLRQRGHRPRGYSFSRRKPHVHKHGPVNERRFSCDNPETSRSKHGTACSPAKHRA